MKLDRDERLRYRGHLSLCEIDLPGHEAVRRSRVLVVGVGGLGSPVAMFLAEAGVGKLGLIDPDTVSLGNLQRQILHATPDLGRLKVDSAREKLTAVNPDVEIITYPEYLTAENAPELLAGYDIVADCTDSFATRLLVSDLCVAAGKPYVFASVSRFTGQIFTHLPGSADYRDIFGELPPDYEAPCAIDGILNSVVGVMGSLQATEILKYITSAGDLLTNRLLTFDAITMKFSEFAI